MLKALSCLLDCIFLARPIVLIPVWGFAVFGYWQSTSRSLADLTQAWMHPDTAGFVWILVFSLSVACVYVLNQIADMNVDRHNQGFPLLASGAVSKKAAAITVSVTALVSCMLPLIAGHRMLVILSVAAIITGLLYSFRPTYLSGRPFFDFLTNGLGFGVIAFGCGWHIGGGNLFTVEFLRTALPYFLLMCAGSISSTIPDLRGDHACGKRTTAVAMGARPATLLALFTLISALALGIVLKDHIVIFSSGVALPLYLLYLLRPSKVLEEAVYKAGGGTCMLAAALLSPMFVAVSATVVVLTRIYFRLRHNVSYPSLVPAGRA
ncbi:MAG: UbiA prenyltransferase family protein [Chitinispirillaceae bacterium]|nr:UbiA prenyltransferase family protein [Chitinispirillaceae bacterium]